MVHDISEAGKKHKRRCPETRIFRAILASHIYGRALRRLWCVEMD